VDERSLGAVSATYLAIFWHLDHETEFRRENLAGKDEPELETELEKLQKESISALREKRWLKSALSAASSLRFAYQRGEKTAGPRARPGSPPEAKDPAKPGLSVLACHGRYWARTRHRASPQACTPGFTGLRCSQVL
jgi:hypothetical protein